ncbi:hypothetical protein HF1_01880 [Mycoplasma haemofelis str. Langford 1]|uniref:Uncharacterized protein n=1 Tax=Mycoplasma haemofelis (strain Langford 1) TaxID=941640 RepID=E8ZKN0_MYCHL|nr:hypothetical protein HF1_01880 [Mycoplasma haemofelis str. Langford 1]
MVSKSIAAGTVGVAGAGGVGTWYLLSDTKEVISISKKIEEQGERFILSTFESAHDTQWDSLIQSYSSLVSNNPNKKTNSRILQQSSHQRWVKSVMR